MKPGYQPPSFLFDDASIIIIEDEL